MEGMTGVALKAARLLSVTSSTSRVEDVLNGRLPLNVRWVEYGTGCGLLH